MKKGQRVVMLVPGCNGNQDQGNLVRPGLVADETVSFVRDDGKVIDAMVWEVAPIPDIKPTETT